MAWSKPAAISKRAKRLRTETPQEAWPWFECFLCTFSFIGFFHNFCTTLRYYSTVNLDRAINHTYVLSQTLEEDTMHPTIVVSRKCGNCCNLSGQILNRKLGHDRQFRLPGTHGRIGSPNQKKILWTNMTIMNWLRKLRLRTPKCRTGHIEKENTAFHSQLGEQLVWIHQQSTHKICQATTGL